MRHASSIASILSLAILGCGSPDISSPDFTIDESLAASYGGEVATDEPPAFGDPLMTSGELALEDASVADAATDRPELEGAQHVRIALVWGYPRPRPDAEAVVDWSGTITVANAGVRVLRALRFEERSDVVIRPRTDVHTIAFESQTKPHADGLLLDVVLAPSLNPDGLPVTLSFDSAVYSNTITLEPGMRRHQVDVVDDAGHVIAYQVIRPDRDASADGFFRGRWQAAGEVEGRVLGRLAGRFFGADGQLRGHLRGVYGVRESGSQVWFGKVIGRDGAFQGLVAGRWADGKLGGLILGRGEIVKGVLAGHYFEAATGDAGGFLGRWSERCGEDPREETAAGGDEPAVAL